MSSDEEQSRSERRKKRRSRSPSSRKKRDDWHHDNSKCEKRRRHRSRSRDSEDRDTGRSDRRRDSREDHASHRRRSQSPQERHRPQNGRNSDKPATSQRPKLFQRAPDSSVIKDDPNSWSTRIAAVTSDDGQRSKFEKLLGMHKKQPNADGETNKPALVAVAESDVKSMRKELAKVEHDLDSQYEHARAFRNSFRGRGL